jgi:hypothetical protein
MPSANAFLISAKLPTNTLWKTCVTMALCTRCANIDLDDAAVRNTYLLGHLGTILLTAEGGCPGCNFIVDAARRHRVRALQSSYVVLRRLGPHGEVVRVSCFRLDGDDDGDSSEEESSEEGDERSGGEEDKGSDEEENKGSGEDEHDKSSDEVLEEDKEEGSEDGRDDESGDSSDDNSEDITTFQLRLSSTYGLSSIYPFL